MSSLFGSVVARVVSASLATLSLRAIVSGCAVVVVH